MRGMGRGVDRRGESEEEGGGGGTNGEEGECKI